METLVVFIVLCKRLTSILLEEMRQKNIASYNCRQLSVNDESADGVVHQKSVATTLHHLLVCPGNDNGRQSRTLNMILLDGLAVR